MSSRKRANCDEDFVPDSEDDDVEKESIDTQATEAESKKKKKKKKKQWKEEEELAVLKEMVRFWKEEKSDPATNKDSFLGFMRLEGSSDFSQVQLKNKIHKLHKMYKEEKAANRGKVIMGSHKEQVLKLCHSIWGQKAEPDNEGDKEDEDEETSTGQTCFNELWRYHTKISSRVGIGDDILTQALDLVEEQNLQEWDQQWKELQLQQIDLNMKAAKLYHDQTQSLLRALKASSGNASLKRIL
ncbi:GLABROUS1 enhancer-binding protein family - like 4 [Theobroma cacao]|nr:GLABROUS1 enhancer-binding protein family - like 4 [Theobroma cacao]